MQIPFDFVTIVDFQCFWSISGNKFSPYHVSNREHVYTADYIGKMKNSIYKYIAATTSSRKVQCLRVKMVCLDFNCTLTERCVCVCVLRWFSIVVRSFPCFPYFPCVCLCLPQLLVLTLGCTFHVSPLSWESVIADSKNLLFIRFQNA